MLPLLCSASRPRSLTLRCAPMVVYPVMTCPLQYWVPGPVEENMLDTQTSCEGTIQATCGNRIS